MSDEKRSETSDSDLVFELVDRLTARGYQVDVSVKFPSGGGITLRGEPESEEEPLPESLRMNEVYVDADGCRFLSTAHGWRDFQGHTHPFGTYMVKRPLVRLVPEAVS